MFLSFGKNVFDVWFAVGIIFKIRIMCWGNASIGVYVKSVFVLCL